MSQGMTEPIPDYPVTTPEDQPVVYEESPALVRVLPEDTPFRDHATNNVTLPAGTASTGGELETLIGEDQKRRRYRVYLLNTHAADPVSIMRGKTDAAFGGFILPAGQALEDFSHGAFYGAVPVGGLNAVTVSILVEYEAEPSDE